MLPRYPLSFATSTSRHPTLASDTIPSSPAMLRLNPLSFPAGACAPTFLRQPRGSDSDPSRRQRRICACPDPALRPSAPRPARRAHESTALRERRKSRRAASRVSAVTRPRRRARRSQARGRDARAGPGAEPARPRSSGGAHVSSIGSRTRLDPGTRAGRRHARGGGDRSGRRDERDVRLATRIRARVRLRRLPTLRGDRADAEEQCRHEPGDTACAAVQRVQRAGRSLWRGRHGA